VVILSFISFVGHVRSIGFGYGSSLDSSTVLFDIFPLVLDPFVVLSLSIELLLKSLATDILERCKTRGVFASDIQYSRRTSNGEDDSVSSACEESGSVLACHKSFISSSDCHKFSGTFSHRHKFSCTCSSHHKFSCTYSPCHKLTVTNSSCHTGQVYIVIFTATSPGLSLVRK
jgi:hypothetical protein